MILSNAKIHLREGAPMTVAENIDALLVRFDINAQTLAKVLDVNPATVHKWRHGSIPREDQIAKMCDYFLIDRDDIMSDAAGLAAKEHGRIAPSLPRKVKLAPADMSFVPLRGRVHAGPMSEPESLADRGDQVLIPAFLVEQDPDTYACEVEGDCMNRVYPEGCVVAVSPNREPQNGSVAVVSIDGADAVMRRMYRTPRTLVLSPDSFNPEHEDIVVTSDTDHSVEFGGKVVWFQAREELL